VLRQEAEEEWPQAAPVKPFNDVTQTGLGWAK
jgi:hypothetical protein